MDDLAAMARVFDSLRPWLEHLVVVGGWAHQLHRYHPAATAPAHQPVRTKDGDLAFSAEAPLKGDMAAALKSAGFREELLGDHAPPAAHYALGAEDPGFYVEFLAPRLGSGVRRDGAPDATILKAGVTAQKLRHVEILLTHPWSVQLDRLRGFPIVTAVEVRFANPVSYMVQKFLIRRYREPRKQAQDVLYIHDTLQLFGENLPLLKAEWREHVQPTLLPKTAKALIRMWRAQFDSVTDVIREAARIPQDRSLSPERVLAVCEFGLESILGS